MTAPTARVAPVTRGDVPPLVSATAAGNESAAQLLPPVLRPAARVRSKKGLTCPCCGARIRRPFATVLIHQAGKAEPNLAAAICGRCAGAAEFSAAW